MLNIRHNHLTVVLFAASIFILFLNVDIDGAQQTALEPIVSLTAEERAWLKAHPDIRLGYTDTLEPEVIVDRDGTYSGMLVDFLDALNERLGTRIGLRVYSISEAIDKAKKKSIDGIPNLHPEYADSLGLIKTQVYWPAYLAVFARRGVSFERPYNFTDKRVAIIDKVHITQKFLDRHGKQATIVKVDDAVEGLRRVENGTADLFLGFSYNSFYIPKYHLLGVVPAHVFMDSPEWFAIGIRGDWPELVSILNKGIASFSKQEIHAIISKWSYLPQKTKAIELTSEESAWLAQNHRVRVRLTEHPPYMFSKDGKAVGIAVDFLKAVTDKTGIAFHYTMASPTFSESLKGLIQHTGPDLIASLSLTPEREKKISFTKAYVFTPLFIFTRDDAEFISRTEQLSGKTVAVVENYRVHKLIAGNYPNISLLVFKNNEDALRAVSAGKAFAFIGGLISTPFMINEYGLKNLKASAPSSLPQATVAMGIRNDWPELRDIMNKVFDAMPVHERSAISNKWSSVKIEYGVRPADIVKWILIVAGGALSIVCFFLFWNRTLAKKVRERTVALENSSKTLETEVAQRIRAEQTLLESHNYLKSITNSLPDAVFSVKYPERIIQWANDTFKVLGYDPDECIGKTTEFLYPSKKEFLTIGDKIARAMAENKDVFHTEALLQNKNGDVFPADITLSFFKEKEDVVSITAIVRDISHRKKSEEVLKESEEKFRHLVEQSPLSIQIFNADGHIFQVNEAWKQLWGLSEALLPEILEKYNVLEDEEARELGVLPLIEKAFKGESVILPVVQYDASITMENLDVVNAGGSKPYIQLRLYPIKNSKGEVVNVVGIEEDITERKQAELEIQQYQDRLKALASQLTLTEEKERRAIAADLHDHVGHSLALARMQLESIPQTKSELEKNILVKDVSNILLAALQDTRNLISELSSPSMHEIGLGAAVADYLEEQIAKRHGLKTEFVDNSGDAHRKNLDENARALLFRNVRELLVNVVKHAQANKVRVHLSEESNKVKITVEDNGIGFASRAINDHKAKNGGFGLFSIQERMTDLGGTFDIQSEPGKGCRVTLTVPVGKK